MKNLRILLIFQISFTLLGWGMTLSIFGAEAALSFLVAGGTVASSFLSIGLVLRSMFLKKSIALLVVIIVFKWPILIYLLLWFTQSNEVHPTAFAIGSLTWLPSALAWHLTTQKD